MNWTPDTQKDDLDAMALAEEETEVENRVVLPGRLSFVAKGRKKSMFATKQFPTKKLAALAGGATHNHSTIAGELGVRTDDPRFAGIRDATRRVTLKSKQRRIEVPPLERLLLGSPARASLPNLVDVEERRASTAQPLSSEAKAALKNIAKASGGKDFVPSPSPRTRRKRRHMVFTSATGFVRYSG